MATSADALVSIHANSCIDRSGFKVARALSSTKSELDDYLVGCLGARYAEATGIAFDASTITEDMTEYHAFKRVAASTPAAIIETGFMGGDWPVIGKQPDLAARGIADGVICFLEGLQPPSEGRQSTNATTCLGGIPDKLRPPAESAQRLGTYAQFIRTLS